MKCPYCGGEITLEQKFCPWCGRENEAAAMHVRDMEKYARSFEETEAEVYQTTRRFSGTAVRVTILAVLIVLIFVFLGAGAASWRIVHDADGRKADANYKTYSAQMDAYLKERDYLAFNDFIEARGIQTSRDTYQSYSNLAWAASSYGFLYEYLMNLAEGNQTDYTVKSLAENVNNFYQYTSDDRWDEYSVPTRRKEMRNYYWQMCRDTGDLLAAYLKLTPEERDGLPGMKDSARRRLIEDRAEAIYPGGDEDA